jgi:hypothetical protein
MDELIRELEPIFVDLFGGHSGEHAADVPFQRFLGYSADFLWITSEEALDGISQDFRLR